MAATRRGGNERRGHDGTAFGSSTSRSFMGDARIQLAAGVLLSRGAKRTARGRVCLLPSATGIARANRAARRRDQNFTAQTFVAVAPGGQDLRPASIPGRSTTSIDAGGDVIIWR